MTGADITTLPLSEVDSCTFAQCADASFRRVLEEIEAQNPETTRELWNAEAYVGSVLTEHKLPISRGYALHLVEAFMLQHVVELAIEADRRAS